MAYQSSVKAASITTLPELAATANAHRFGGLEYAGDITPHEAFSYLQSNPAILVDVRTLPEWQFTGTPDITGTQGKLVTISWKTYPGFVLNAQFGQMMASIPDIDKDTPLFFICRSGGRSLDAAVSMTQAGYRYCFNITGGFEGEPDVEGHRSTAQGWKAAQLPWRQG